LSIIYKGVDIAGINMGGKHGMLSSIIKGNYTPSKEILDKTNEQLINNLSLSGGILGGIPGINIGKIKRREII
jgi:hypothetical protein